MKTLTTEDLDRGWIKCPCGREAVVYKPGMVAIRAVALCPECGIVAMDEAGETESKDGR